MNNEPIQTETTRCSQCGSSDIRAVRRNRVHQGIIIENIPATFCPNCGEELYDLATVQLIEQIVATPEAYTQMVERPVARVA